MADRDFLPIETKEMNETKEANGASEAGAADDAVGSMATVPDGEARQHLESDIVAVLQTIYDPEVPVDIYEMGLIYEVDVRSGGEVYVKMTLTSPMCPVAETLPPEVETKVRGVKGVSNVVLELVWDPPWHPDMMSDAARLELNM